MGLFKSAINDYSKLPKFNNLVDRINGLGISVHDTWATHIVLESLEIKDNRFYAVVTYRIQDHFGLDDTDALDPFYIQLRIFRVWFLLQRWEKYGFKSFITEMNVEVRISGMHR